ncbi:44184_t:CDS:2 [Gigaspora margarita]|uniref:44184_t:CDS:1 n=1 Tax=Gigaspora margarita TaxID=4874 RepID=A0ABN7UXF9_GIGMA|nr:44184_t:CDS:2 [Gigaspora margarita]
MTQILCSLYQHKTFKNNRSLQLHWQRTHQVKDNNSIQIPTSDSTCVFCKLCPKKSYNTQKGLNRHKTIAHSHYNTPQVGLIPQPPEAIIEFKCLLVHMIQTKLKTKSQFIGVFNGYINRYSPSYGWYRCIFMGTNAYEKLGQIFRDEKWGVREYENNQQTWVILNGSENEKTKYLEIR